MVAAVEEGVERVTIRCQTAQEVAYGALIGAGWQAHWTDLRMTLDGSPGAAGDRECCFRTGKFDSAPLHPTVYFRNAHHRTSENDPGGDEQVHRPGLHPNHDDEDVPERQRRKGKDEGEAG